MIALRCPHCSHEVLLTLSAAESSQGATLKARPKVCACGHDAHEGPCQHGKGTAFGGCPCPGMHARRRGASSPSAPSTMSKTLKASKTRAKAANGAADVGSLTSYQRALLRVLKQHRNVNRHQLALIAGYSPNSGTFTEALAVLRAAGLLERLALTPAGELAAGAVEALPTGEGLVHYWCERVGDYAGTLLQVLVTAYPSELARDELAERAGYRTSGTFTEQIATLRKLDLITKRGLRASESLMGSVRLIEGRS